MEVGNDLKCYLCLQTDTTFRVTAEFLANYLLASNTRKLSGGAIDNLARSH